jgi:hypothetical protein
LSKPLNTTYSVLGMLLALQRMQDTGDNDGMESGLRTIWQLFEKEFRSKGLHLQVENLGGVLILAYYFAHKGDFTRAVNELRASMKKHNDEDPEQEARAQELGKSMASSMSLEDFNRILEVLNG